MLRNPKDFWDTRNAFSVSLCDQKPKVSDTRVNYQNEYGTAGKGKETN